MFTPEQAQGLAMFFFKSLESEFQITKRVLAAVPENQLQFKLGDKGKTAQDLMWHIVESEVWFGNGISSLSFGPPTEPDGKPTTVAGMVARFEKDVPAALEKVKAMTGEQLATSVNFFDMMNMPAVTYLSFWVNHTVHHRGQLSSYLRAMNARVPSIYGPSADEGMAASG